MIRVLLGFVIWALVRAYTIVFRKPHCTFNDPDTGEAYLTRWWLGPNSEWPDAQGRTGGEGKYLHFFHRSDWSRNLHNHPSKFGAALVLRGGYIETRIDDGGLTTRYDRYPGDVNVITQTTFHRVELMDPKGSWSLFYIGPRSGKGWGFIQEDGSVARADHFDGRTGALQKRDV
jgi:hypothetical protein